MRNRVLDDLPSEYQRIVRQLIKHLRKPSRSWVASWYGGDFEPRNHLTLRYYLGINAMILWSAAHALAFKHQRWLTAKQAERMGGRVKLGERGTTIIFGTQNTRKAARIQEQTGRWTPARGLYRQYVLYNIDQVEGLPSMPEPPRPSPDHINPALEALVAATGIEIRFGGVLAFYYSADRYIQMPLRDTFYDPAHDYYRVLLHEIAHFLMPPLEIEVGTGDRFAQRGWQEIAAELTSIFVCQHFGIGLSIRSASYMAEWFSMVERSRPTFFNANWLLEIVPVAHRLATQILSYAKQTRKS